MSFLKMVLNNMAQRYAKLTRTEVFKKLNREREYQQSRWSPTDKEYGTCHTRLRSDQEHKVERYHEVGAWISFMETYLEEARDLNSKTDDLNAALLKIRCVGALAVACLEQHGCPDRPEPVKAPEARSGSPDTRPGVQAMETHWDRIRRANLQHAAEEREKERMKVDLEDKARRADQEQSAAQERAEMEQAARERAKPVIQIPLFHLLVANCNDPDCPVHGKNGLFK